MAVPAKKSVQLFFDVISPYTWIAFEELCRYRTKWNIDLEFKPMLLGAVISHTGNRPPAMVPAKGAYGAQDLTRLRQLYQIPLGHPADFMHVMMNKGSLNPQRFITAVQLERPELTEPLSRELWMRIWSRDEDITTPESLKTAGKQIGLADTEADHFLKRIKDNDVKEKLKTVTQEAIDAGAFGAPTIIVHDSSNKKHLVFGSDRMQVIAMLLGEKYFGPLNELAKTKL